MLVTGTVASPSTTQVTLSVAGTSSTVTSGPDATAFSFRATVPAGLSPLTVSASPPVAVVLQHVAAPEQDLPTLAGTALAGSVPAG